MIMARQRRFSQGAGRSCWLAYPRSSWLFLLLVVLFHPDNDSRSRSHLVCSAQESTDLCTLCHGGATPSGTYPGGLECSMVAAAIGSTPADSAECREAQISAVEYCSCGELPPGVCPLCDNGTVMTYPQLPLPGVASSSGGNSTTTTTCQSVAFATECLEVPYNAAWYCGCVSAGSTRPVAGGSICNTATATTSPNNATTAVLPIHANRILPNDLTTTCLQYDRTLGVLGEAAAQLAGVTVIGDLPAYCGCPESINIIFPKECDVCAGQLLLNPSRVVVAGTSTTCTQLQIMADYVTDAPYCSTLQQEYSAKCCQATAAPVTVAPISTAPVVPAPPVAAPVVATNTTTVAAVPSPGPVSVATNTTAPASAAVVVTALARCAAFVIGGVTYLFLFR
jgi:hypothetical protein